MKYFILILPLFYIFTGNIADAQNTGSGLDFLNVGPSARLLALNEAGTASPIGPSAIFTNPALLILEDNSSADINYTSWISGVNNQYGAINLLRENHALVLPCTVQGQTILKPVMCPDPRKVHFLSVTSRLPALLPNNSGHLLPA